MSTHSADAADRLGQLSTSRLAAFVRRHTAPLLYSTAVVSYIAIGSFQPIALEWWGFGYGTLLFWVWLVPAIVRRCRR